MIMDKIQIGQCLKYFDVSCDDNMLTCLLLTKLWIIVWHILFQVILTRGVVAESIETKQKKYAVLVLHFCNTFMYQLRIKATKMIIKDIQQIKFKK